MTDRKKWGLAAIITGVLFAAVGIVVFFTTATPAWLAPAIYVVETILGVIGVTLLAKPEPPIG